jgi:hypothetical protein
MIVNCDDAPVGNLLIDRDGICYPIAGGASNCAGKGNQMSFSRGVGSANNGNVWGFQIECANNGVGEAWPEAQVDALYRASNALNAAVGNQPTDVTSHALGDGTGYTDRKIDPATASAVQGELWWPDAVNGSGTWSLPQIREECAKRAGQAPPTPTPVPPTPTPVPPTPTPTPPTPTPTPPPSEDWMANLPVIKKGDSGPAVKRMQHLLAAAGYMNEANTANYDGVWGNGTDSAKVKFDTDHGLLPSPPTDCGDKSWAALNGA